MSAAAPLPARRGGGDFRPRRAAAKAGAIALGIVLLIWSLLPIYNMVLVALERHGEAFISRIWPALPSLEGFWGVVTEGYWYLENFWRQFGNSLYMGVMTMFFTLLIGSLASFAMGRMRSAMAGC